MDALNNLYTAASLAPLNAQQHQRLIKDAQQLAAVLEPSVAVNGSVAPVVPIAGK